jgi:formate dehydrogenase subunit beta
MQAVLRQKAKDLLAGSRVKLVLGYGESFLGGGVRPVFVETADAADRLVWNERCAQNLATYLTREPCAGVLRGAGRVAIVAKGCDVRAIVGLMQEKQVKREGVHIIGVVCEGVKVDERGETVTPTKCAECEVHNPAVSDELVGTKSSTKPAPDSAGGEAKRIAGMSEAERWQYWTSVLDRCIKCYACRQACPLCYCKECITEKSRPQWIDKSSGARGNLAYHFIRAIHLAGRCVGCEECRRACPMGIPVDVLSRYLSKKVEEAFGYKPGMDPKAEPFFVVSKPDDPEDFIL